MNFSPNGQPFMVLVDDDSHSARLMIRMLLAHGSPSVTWIDNAEDALERLASNLGDSRVPLPGLVIVDLKSSSADTADFIVRLRTIARGANLLVAAMASSLERGVREGLLRSGADAVFERHGSIESYRGEIASIVSFWARHRRLDAVGT